MATPKKKHCDQAISQLKEQAKRFDAMSLLYAKSPHLARQQANEIADWSSKLINAVNKIRHDAQAAATASHEMLQNQIQGLEGQANSTKRKILDTNQLDSSRTLKANFRLIFGPEKPTENRAATTRHSIHASAERITRIRALCESNPDSVMTLSTSYPTKTWIGSSRGAFEGIIEIVKRETQQDWPDEIIDIMDELEAELPMSVEFRNLRANIARRKGWRRQRIDDSRQFGHDLPSAAGRSTSHGPHSQSDFANTYCDIDRLQSIRQMASLTPHFDEERWHNGDDTGATRLRTLCEKKNATSYPAAFKDVASQAQSSPASQENLMSLLCFLHAESGLGVPDSIFDRVRQPFKQWGPDGEIEEMTPSQFGIQQSTLRIISDRLNIVEKLNSTNDSTNISHSSGHLKLHISSEAASDLRKSRSDWKRQAFMLVCFTFPLDGYMEPMFGLVGNSHLPQLVHVLGYLDQLELSTDDKAHTAKVLLAASQFSDTAWKRVALTKAQELIADTHLDYIKLHIKCRMIAVARYEPDGTGQDQVSEDIRNHLMGQDTMVYDVLLSRCLGLLDVQSKNTEPDARMRAILGELVHCAVSQYQFTVKDLKDAISFVWKFFNANPIAGPLWSTATFQRSSLEQTVTARLSIALGRMCRYQGDFHKAQEYLTSTMAFIAIRKDLDHYNKVCCDLLSHHIAVQCELGNSNGMQELITEHSSLLPSSKGRKRRLDLSLAEYNLRFGDYDAARVILERLQTVYMETPATYANGIATNRNEAFRWCHIRVLVGLAQLHHYRGSWPLAFDGWKKALQAVEQNGWAEGYYFTIIYFSLGHAYFHAGEIERAEHCHRKAFHSFEKLGRQYWHTGLGTYWLDYVMSWNSGHVI